ncbi:peptidase S41 family protein-like protein [Westerdykella ornata]|uniref:Peptidase S41 family protein-like protein n=1 Tax=Westerdykella ornata TaxID=318751 RepID=A0A6A6JXE3_WESOR|nr:peptidase S41 family protein-like protein [Westerdykella ornata]KAF2280406.1 peptidase S41 family protein-like protein [Westerdykella ornata]
MLALAGLAMLATPTPVAPVQPLTRPHAFPHSLLRRQNNTIDHPCARVARIYNESTPNFYGQTQVPAGLAYACITSVPLNVASAKKLLRRLPAYLNWQSTLTALANPPEEYVQKVQPPVDLIAGLGTIDANLDAGKYSNEYEFGWDLYKLFISAHDGHLNYVPDSVGAVFNWGRPVPLVSVSEDGKKLPSVFAYPDVLGSQFKNISYTPSPVVEIDGQDVFTWLENESQFAALQDRDALYNSMFYELAQVGLSTSGIGTGMFTGGGRARWKYPGHTTTLKFANGTSFTMQNYARVMANFRYIKTGEDVAKKVFYYGPALAGADEEQEEEDLPPQGPSAAVGPGYPTPVVPGPANLINGFFIDAPGYEDVAVLHVPNFVGDTSIEIAFQRVTQQFIPQALAAGKTKLIIDLQANGGGTILQGYDMFKQLFPALDPFALNRFRAIEPVDLIGQSYSAWTSQYPRSELVSGYVRQYQATYFDYRSDMTADGRPFSSWDEKFGPVDAYGDKYTSYHRWNLSDVHITWNSGGIYITGYGPLANVSRVAPFKPENIVLLTDGYCASTCSIFSELMTKIAGVKTIAFGGRSNSDRIQAVGGVKGTNNFQFSYIQNLAQTAMYLAQGDLKKQLNNSVLRDYYDDIVFYRAASTPGVNVRDGIRANDSSGVALQFVYEEADCRLYYTPEMTVDVTAIWKAAADAQWRDRGKCVGGSGYGKRAAREKTMRLSRRRTTVSQAAALAQLEAFERTFKLETDCRLSADGFMQP